MAPLPQAPRAKPVAAGDLSGDFDGWGGVDEIDVIFLGAWLAAPAELRGSRTRVGRYRRRRRGTPNADDNLVCVGMENWVCGGVRVFWSGPIPVIWRGETGEVQVVRGSDGRSGG